MRRLDAEGVRPRQSDGSRVTGVSPILAVVLCVAGFALFLWTSVPAGRSHAMKDGGWTREQINTVRRAVKQYGVLPHDPALHDIAIRYAVKEVEEMPKSLRWRLGQKAGVVLLLSIGYLWQGGTVYVALIQSLSFVWEALTLWIDYRSLRYCRKLVAEYPLEVAALKASEASYGSDLTNPSAEMTESSESSS
jgi:hypothetical protein